ncbi:hypothetical protein EFA69_15785 [Rufibacter immobilis]|uniref:Uncharacterized protein n=1 Tax=Rufibacter immobilis TaxID=1348778 RepID=A0A3M9MPX2_9BACT|nr:hypothetical protein EFA69_15785 [Rufibacter immobilis]
MILRKHKPLRKVAQRVMQQVRQHDLQRLQWFYDGSFTSNLDNGAKIVFNPRNIFQQIKVPFQHQRQRRSALIGVRSTLLGGADKA